LNNKPIGSTGTDLNASQEYGNIKTNAILEEEDREVELFDGLIKLDKKKAEKLAKKVAKGKKFDLEDLRDQLQQMQNLGGLGGIMDKLPGMGQISQMAQNPEVTKQFKRMECLIDSMTPAERRNPDILNGSRKRRITQGSGTQIQDLNRLLKQHKQMAKMMKKVGKKGGMNKMMRGMGGMMPGPGGMPPGGNFPGGGGFPGL